MCIILHCIFLCDMSLICVNSVTTQNLFFKSFIFFSFFYLCSFNYSLFFVVYFLVFSVCEGSLGLSILVSIIRSHGNDYFQSYSVLQC
jgi:NADH-ubiquinone oxidoreductase chain 4L